MSHRATQIGDENAFSRYSNLFALSRRIIYRPAVPVGLNVAQAMPSVSFLAGQ
jgi:hypothetical protein